MNLQKTLDKTGIFCYNNFMKKRFGGKPSGNPKFQHSSKRRGPRIIGMKFKSDPVIFDAAEKAAANRAKSHAISPAFAKKTQAARLVQSLQDKKTRTKTNLFLVEGETSVIEALEASYVPHSLFMSHEFLGRYPEIKTEFPHSVHMVDEGELVSLGTLAMNKSVIGVFEQKKVSAPRIGNEIIIALAGVNDPGNLGTIIRVADWFGIKTIIASHDTVDSYNPKTISATKGSFARVDVHYMDLEDFFADHKDLPVFAADMRGENIHETKFPFPGILLLGSESHGIPDELAEYLTKRITIPRIGGAESLNVGVAGAIILDNWLRSS